MNIISSKLLEDGMGCTEVIMRRGAFKTYKALEGNRNRMVVIKEKRKSERTFRVCSAFHGLDELNSPYLVRYLTCYEDEKACKVKERVMRNRIDRNGEL